MTIACSKCGRVHSLPDGSSDNKRLSFFCTQCNHRIVVDGRKNFVAGTTGVASFTESSDLPSFTSLLESTSCLFSAQSFLVSVLFSVVSFLFLSVVSFIILKNASFFFSNRPILFILIGTTGFLLFYGYSILFYLIARIRYYKIDHPNEGNVDWKYVLFDLPEDLLTLLVFFVCIPLSVILVSLPIRFLNEGGALYSGLVLPFIIPLVLLCIIMFIFLRFVPAAIAGKSLYFRQSVLSLKSFAVREALHLPFYAILIELISFLVAIIVLFFFWTAVVTATGLLSSLLDLSFINSFKACTSAGLFQISGDPILSAFSFPVKAGALLFSFTLIVAFLLSLSFIITVSQNLTTQACWIMYSNPGKSVPKNILVSIYALCAVVFIGLLWAVFFFRIIFR